MATVFIEVDKPFYIAGDTVNGYVFLNLFQNMNGSQVIVKFKGWESVKWYEKRVVTQTQKQGISPHLIYQNVIHMRMDSSDSEDHPGQDEWTKYNYVMEGYTLMEVIRYTGQKQIARFDSVLYNFGGSFIPAGQYSFPFSFKTGQNFPASFMDKPEHGDRRGRIKYEMQAFIRGFNDRLLLLRTKRQIIIREMAPIKNDHQQMQAHVTSCCCIDQGITRIQCFFQKNGYVPGQEARIYCKLDNTEGKSDVNSVDVYLRNEITYTSSNGHKKTFTQNIFKRQFSGLGAGEQGERQNVVAVVNANRSSHPEDIKPTARGNRLHSVYYLVVDANLAAMCTCCSDLPIVRQPVLIYPFIPLDYNFNPPPNWHPKVMPSINLQLPSLSVNPMNVNMNVGMNMNGPAMHVNVPSPTMHINVNSPTMHVEVPSPQIEMNVHPPNHSHYQGAGVGVSVGGMGVGVNVGMHPL